MKQILAIFVFLASSSCTDVQRIADPDNYRARADNSVWASKNDIKQAAKACGLHSFEPHSVSDTGAWSLGGGTENPSDDNKFQCLQDSLDNQDLLVTR